MNFYKGYEQMIEFSANVSANPFGAQLLSMLEQRFDSIEEAVEVLTSGLDELGFDVDPEGVVGLLTGKIAPSEDLVEALEGMASNEAEAERLWSSAVAAHEVQAENDEEYEDEEDEDDYAYEEVEDEEYEEEDEDEDIEDSYSNVPVTHDSKVEQLYTRQMITDELNNLSSVADQMMAGGEGLMTPYIKELLFGRSDQNRYVNFMAATEAADTTPEEYLKCLEFSLNLLSELESLDSVYFQTQAKDEVNEMNFSSNSSNDERVEKEALEMLKLMNL